MYEFTLYARNLRETKLDRCYRGWKAFGFSFIGFGVV